MTKGTMMVTRVLIEEWKKGVLKLTLYVSPWVKVVRIKNGTKPASFHWFNTDALAAAFCDKYTEEYRMELVSQIER